jgi:hypothetical protein
LIDIFLLQVSKNTRLQKGAPGFGIRPSKAIRWRPPLNGCIVMLALGTAGRQAVECVFNLASAAKLDFSTH